MRPTVSQLIIAIAACFIFAAAAHAQETANWNRWGGADGKLVSTESGFETDWNAHPPQKIWDAKVGTGFSSVVVVDEKLYTMGRSGKKDDAVFCLDANTGTEIWKKSYPAALEPRMFEGGPGATPTVVDGVVYTIGRQGQAFAFDAASGDQIWHVDTLKETGAKQPYWGITSSALVVDNKVVFDVGCLLALDAKTGNVIWKTDNHAAGYGSAIEFTIDGNRKIAALSNEGLMVVNIETGNQEAFTKWKTQYATNSTTPVIEGNKFFVSTGYKRGCAMFELANNKFKTVYENKSLSNHMNNSVWFQGHLYGIDGNSHRSRTCKLTCIDAATGDKKWAEMGFGCGSVMIAGDQLIVLGDSGELSIGPASPTGFQATGKIKAVKGKCWTVPVLLNGKIYCRTADGDISCLSLKRKEG